MRISSRAVAALLLLAAVILHFASLQYGTDIITTHGNGSVTRTIAASPIVETSMSVSELACFAKRPCDEVAVAQVSGLYPRDWLTESIAILLGAAAPALLILAAAYLAFRGRRRTHDQDSGATVA